MCRTCSSGRPTARSSASAITRSWLRCRATPWRAAATRTPAASDSERSRAIHSPRAVVVQWGARGLIAAIKWVDEQASVTIQVPSQARRSSRIEVTVVTRGGAGPVVGVSLVDSAIRYQARPISASGFKVVGPALVVGSNGKPQAQWAERRLRGSDMGLNTVMITGIEGDQVTQRVDETHTTWVLRTPPEPGAYSVAAAFYYGTEKGRPLGTVVRNGRAEPRGGPGGASGRIMFSDRGKVY